MPTVNSGKVLTKSKNLFLRVSKGHFATSHSHINYYIDVTMQKTRLSEAQAVAKELASYYYTTTVIDTILCLDGMEVVGACLADELTRGGLVSINSHQTIYVVTPEHTSGSQLIFRDNLVHTITGKHVLVLAASVSTGYTAGAAIEAIKYYGGMVSGICSIFATVDKYMDYDVRAVFDPKDLKDYESYPSHQCPMCQRGEKIDALVNSHGYSKL
ncbi:MAG: orotate phosphoribosyltransferase [Clostridia bacterium]|nr:orotate phosphoribosyltransferase [Clostridia bacterium]